MKKLLYFIEKNKKALIALTISALLILIIIVGALKEEREETAPFLRRTPPEEVTEGTEGSESPYLEEVVPPSGDRGEKLGRLGIKMYFNRPIDPTTIKYNVQPHIPLGFYTFSEDNKELTILPTKWGWVEDLEYTIRITEIRDIGGNILIDKPITYKYYLKLPEDFAGGESWAEEEEGYFDYQERFEEEVGTPGTSPKMPSN